MGSLRQFTIEGQAPQFDLRTCIRDPKTGKTIKMQDYIRFVSQSYGEYYKCLVTGLFFDAKGVEITDPKAPIARTTEPTLALKK